MESEKHLFLLPWEIRSTIYEELLISEVHAKIKLSTTIISTGIHDPGLATLSKTPGIRNNKLDPYLPIDDLDEGNFCGMRIAYQEDLTILPTNLRLVSRAFSDDVDMVYNRLCRLKHYAFDLSTLKSVILSNSNPQYIVKEQPRDPAVLALLRRSDFTLNASPRDLMTTLMHLPRWFRDTMDNVTLKLLVKGHSNRGIRGIWEQQDYESISHFSKVFRVSVQPVKVAIEDLTENFTGKVLREMFQLLRRGDISSLELIYSQIPWWWWETRHFENWNRMGLREGEGKEDYELNYELDIESMAPSIAVQFRRKEKYVPRAMDIPINRLDHPTMIDYLGLLGYEDRKAEVDRWRAEFAIHFRVPPYI
ncbi:hypothetical protein H072_3116 [Dactylellina haptotyla CBS 200.50]|uniref:Uncharacterized protein n=1 Tax=Dactylellina haptotyla (strain CBS 200.50) TaxID=1284197 RepID=S8ANV0_DACHA|nr:hypothetical protein H072_3116 [Dactylellina haptotyla CBS 200.50]